MKRYKVIIVKPVTDYLRAFVEVEAEDEDTAKEKAFEKAIDEDSFSFWQCGDCLEETTYEVEEIEDETA
jgi:hypothetical protein